MTEEEAEAFAAEHAAEIQNSVRGSYLLRQILILGILIAAVFLNFANVVAAVVPLVLFRPILMAREAFRKKKA
jgi:predicted membrane-bound spermidine synthase